MTKTYVQSTMLLERHVYISPPAGMILLPEIVFRGFESAVRHTIITAALLLYIHQSQMTRNSEIPDLVKIHV